MKTRAAMGIAALWLCGCGFAPAIEGAPAVSCASTRECPPEFRCVDAIARCVAVNDADTTPPEASGVIITPNPAGPEAEVAVSFDVSEPLAFVPAVSLEIDDGVSRSLEHLEGTRFRYRVDRSEQQGPRPLTAVLVDQAGNVATVSLGALTLDFAPPAVIASGVSPAAARAGDAVTLSVTLDEAPATASARLLGPGGATLSPTAVTLDGVALTATFSVSAETPEGDFVALLDASDAAGNAVAAEVGALLVDHTAPSLVSATLNLSRANPGQLVRVTVVLDEPSAAPPALVASIDDRRFELELEEHAAELAVFRLLPGHGQPDGTWRLAVEDVVDAAGNASGALDAGDLILDGTPPVLAVDARTEGNLRLGDTFEVTVSSSEDLAAPPALSLGGVGMTLVLDGGALGPWSYALSVDALATSGTVLLLADATDLAGNREDPAPVLTAVEVDAVAPAVIDVSFTPASARLGVNVLLAVTVSEPLQDTGQPPVTLRWAAGDPGFVFEGTTLFTHTWSLAVDSAVPPGQHDLIGLSFADTAGNAVDLNESDPELPAALSVDNQPPQVLAVFPDAPVYSRVPGHDTITVTAFVDDDGQDPASVEGTVAGRPMRCDVLAAESPNVSCSYDVTDADAEGAVPIVVNAFDAAGNLGAGSAIVTLDFTPPDIAPNSSRLTLRPAPGALVDDVEALSRRGVAELSFITTEAVTSTPDVVSFPLGLEARAVVTQRTFFSYELAAGGSTQEGVHGLGVGLVDDVGNATIVNLPQSLTVDMTPPSAPSPSALTYRRVPWGEDGKSKQSFAVRGEPGATEPNARVLVFDAADLTTAVLIGEAKSSADGSVPQTPLSGSDRARVFVAVVDAAGNAHGAVGIAPANVEWHASTGGKIAGSALENPHLVERWERLPGFRDDVDFERRHELSGAVLASVDGDTELALPRPTWTPLPPRGPGANASLHVLEWDPGRGVVVRAGGQRALGLVSRETTEFDGQDWNEVQVPEAPPPAREAAGFFHPTEERLFLLGGAANASGLSVASFDGVKWTVHPAPVFEDRAAAAAAFDEGRGVAVLYGGATSSSISNETLVSADGLSWAQVTTALDPGPRQYAQLAYDPAGARVLMYGGSTDVALWAFDGAEWSIVDDGATGPGELSRFAMGFDRARSRLVLYGGEAPADFLNKVWEWSESGGWVGPLVDPNGPPGVRDARFVFYPPSGRLLLHGGEMRDGGLINLPVVLRAAWLWDGTRFTRIDNEQSGPALEDLTLVRLGLREHLAIDLQDPTEEWRRVDGRWTSLGDPGFTSNRGAAAAISGGALLFTPPQTFVLQDETWTEDLSPGPTSGFAMAATADGGALLVRTDAPTETWRWDGGWTLLPASPPVVSSPAMALDERTGENFLIGNEGVLHSFDGATWTVRPQVPAHPVAASERILVYDPARERIVLTAGFGVGLVRGPTWEFDGVEWTLLPQHRSPRGILGLDAEPDEGGLIATGGLDIALNPSDETAIWRHASLQPAVRFVARVAAAARAGDSVDEELLVRVVARGVGTAPDGGALDGYSVRLFDGRDWTEVAVHVDAALGEVQFSTSSAEELRRYLRASEEVDLLITTRGPVGTGAAELEVDQLSVEVRYREP